MRMQRLRGRRGGAPRNWNDPLELRAALLDFIADFANWDLCNEADYLETSRALVEAAHQALGGLPGTRPLVIDPFAGGGAIPLEALRVGAEAFASDLNPVAVLLNKVVLEYVPKHGQRLADEVRRWGDSIKQEAEKKLAGFYPKDKDGATPIAYLWARTVRCEGPDCGTQIPLLRSLWLAKKGNKATQLRLVPDSSSKRIDIELIENPKGGSALTETVRRGSATCPVCGFTTKVDRVRAQLKERHGGAADARLLCVITSRQGDSVRQPRLPSQPDLDAFSKAFEELKRRKREHSELLSLVPDEEISPNELRRISVPIYGMTRWGDLFTPRQALALSTFAAGVRRACRTMSEEGMAPDLVTAVGTCLALLIGKQADRGSSLCRWDLSSSGGRLASTFGRQAIGMVWDFAEAPPFGDASGDFGIALDGVVRILSDLARSIPAPAVVVAASATNHPLPDDAADCVVTDPPYYDAVPYAYLSDFFYVWLRRSLFDVHPTLLAEESVPKTEEIVVDRPHELSTSTKDVAFYEKALTAAFAEARRVVRPGGLGTIVFASKTTASWEAILQAVVDAGWVITGSWPIDTEMETRVAAQGQARLASSVHLVCRPRETSDGSVRGHAVGDWRDVLAELPRRMHEWMPRLAGEGVVGADAIFACLGPALEIYSRYSRVEKANGEAVLLTDYLEQVWAAVAREALSTVMGEVDSGALEADARLSVIWLWTIRSGQPASTISDAKPVDGGSEDDAASASPPEGYALEYDAARKIAQGLGARLDELSPIVEVKGDKARLLGVTERTAYLFGRTEGAPSAKKAAKKKQMTLFGEMEETAAAQGWGEVGAPKAATTTLDRVHQAMLLFGSGRGEALKRFLVEEGVGKQAQFWKLAQSLSALYPGATDEKRWVDGVLARKKGLGF